MKKFLILAALLLPLASVAQQYKVTGKVPTKTKVYLFRTPGFVKEQADSVVAKNGTFTFTGTTTQPELYYIVKKAAKAGQPATIVPIVADGNVVVDFTTETPSGTAENDALKAALMQVKPYAQGLRAVEKQFEDLEV
ncbi:MAG: DUF4369 domain-containing protein, partial [Alloprevotella tannerae]|nr:DUF4369 domain-containing protein [Alloprevotella tannerae]